MKEDGGRGEGGRGGGGKEKRGSLWSQGENQEEVTMLNVRTQKNGTSFFIKLLIITYFV